MKNTRLFWTVIVGLSLLPDVLLASVGRPGPEDAAYLRRRMTGHSFLKCPTKNFRWMTCLAGCGEVAGANDYAVLAAANGKSLPVPCKVADGREAGQLHVNNWLEAVLEHDPKMTVTNAEGGHLSTAICSLGQMCMTLGRGRKDGISLKWDATSETTGNSVADAMMKPFARDNFDLSVNLKEFNLDFNTIIKE